jgi:hypothetical protein
MVDLEPDQKLNVEDKKRQSDLARRAVFFCESRRSSEKKAFSWLKAAHPHCPIAIGNHFAEDLIPI